MPPAHAVPVLAPAGVPCEQYTARVGPDRSGNLGCMATWTKAPGEQGRTPAEGAWVALGPHVQIAPPGHPNAGMVCDLDNPGKDKCCEDRWGRRVCNGALALPDDLAWWDGAYAHPVPCEPETAPLPTPPATGGGPAKGFRYGTTFVNDRPHYLNCDESGHCRFHNDGTHRYWGVLASGEGYQNTCDRDHWMCAIQPCDRPRDKTADEWAQILIEHRKTFELCGGREWTTPSGVTLHVEGASKVEKDPGNPYGHHLEAQRGDTVKVTGCLDADAYVCRNPETVKCGPDERIPIPGAGGCGTPRVFKVE